MTSASALAVGGRCTAQSLSAGTNHTCLVRGNGTVACWGGNSSRQLGTATPSYLSTPTDVPSVPRAAAVTAGSSHSCALLDDGTVWCWGAGGSGQLGTGSTVRFGAPAPVVGLSGVTEISAGTIHTCALRNDGTVWCWGSNGGGRLGDGTTARRAVPVEVQGLSDVRQVVAGGTHTCALTGDGSAFCWGGNNYGQLGDGTRSTRMRPVPVNIGDHHWRSLWAGTSHTCGVLQETGNPVLCWGKNGQGQLGDGTTATYRTLPAPVLDASGSALTDGVAITAGNGGTCVIHGDGSAKCWGYNASGQLGDGTLVLRRAATPVVAPAGLDKSFLLVAQGTSHTCALALSGDLYCFGGNASGQLGDGTRTRRLVPTRAGTAEGLTFASFLQEDEVTGAQGAEVTSLLAADRTLFAAGLEHAATEDAWVVRRSRDRGANWTTVDRHAFGTTAGAPRLARLTSGNLFVGGAAHNEDGDPIWLVRRSADGGDTWSAVDTFQLERGRPVTVRHAASDASSRVYVAGSADDASGTHWLVRASTDSGQTWFVADDYSVSGGSAEAHAVLDAGTAGIIVAGHVTTPAGTRLHVRRATSIGASDRSTAWTDTDDFRDAGHDTFGESLAADLTGRIYLLARSNSASGWRWLVRSSSDGGTTWQALSSFQLEAGQETHGLELLVDRAGTLHVAGRASRDGAPAHGLVASSFDHGATWVVSDELIGESSVAGLAEDDTGAIHSVATVGTFQNARWISRTRACHGLAPSCGNWVIERGELCDGDCSSCDDHDTCTVDGSSGSATTCDVSCTHTPITACTSGDGCCAPGCTSDQDLDCCTGTIEGGSCLDLSFEITSLATSGCTTVEHSQITGSSRSALAVSSSNVFYTGTGSTNRGVTGRFSAIDLSNGHALTTLWDNMFSDLRTGTVYVLGNSATPLTRTSGTVTTLIPLDPVTGNATTPRVTLSAAIPITASRAFFSGYGRLILHNGASFYDVQIPSGRVTVLGSMVLPQHNTCTGGSSWGLAESFGGKLYITYAAGLEIRRSRLPDGATSVLQGFTNLGDTCALGFSIPQKRWYFHHSGTSQFASGTEILGTCGARFHRPNAPGNCGDGILEGAEACDGDCPTSCDDGLACTSDTLSGSAGACNVTCGHSAVTSCTNGDGCCPAGCTLANDTDCAACAPGQTRACYTGPAGTQGVGRCAAGVETCSNGEWSSCSGDVTPTTESCNGLDDDCNGLTDDGIPSGTACDTGLPGACAAGRGTCTNGHLVCTENVAPSAERCDGVDNDCNGLVDDGASATCPSLAHAVSACIAGQCALATCTGTWSDCDGSAANGCEADLANDPSHCGTCSNTCPVGGCTSGACNCIPTTCGDQCGAVSDGCGRTLSCGACAQPAVAAGQYGACALRGNGTVRCWGDNQYGQLGDGSTLVEYQPSTTVSGVAGATAIAAGQGFFCALVAGGNVRCWGLNNYGQLGDNTTINRSTSVQVGGVTGAVAIAAGATHACAVLSSGAVRCWGYNAYGQLGDGTTTNRSTSVLVSNVSTAQSIAAGNNHTCAILSSGAVWCWGYNGYGQLGDNTVTQRTTPVQATGITNAADLGLGGNFSCASLTTGAISCWGYNGHGELGDNTTTQRNTPVSVSGISTAAEVAAGLYHACARLTDSSIRCWGYNATGQLGDGTATQRTTPVSSNVTGAAGISAGTSHTCALMANGAVQCWGEATYGGLGNETTITSYTAVTVSAFPCGDGGTSNVCSGCTPTTCLAQGLSAGTISDGCGGTLYCGTTDSPLTQVVAGVYFSCGLVADGTVRCWGANDYGQLGNGSTSGVLQPVTVLGVSNARSLVGGEYHVCALIGDGTIKCWGRNTYGQLGDGTTTDRPTAVTVTGITNAVQVTTGRNHGCARLATGTAQCWGYNAYGQLGDGTTTQRTTPVPTVNLPPIASIMGGPNHTCGLLTNGLVRCWGLNSNGQLGNGTTQSTTPVHVPGVSNVIALPPSSDDDSTCALVSDGTVRCWGNNSYGQLGDGTATQRTTAQVVPGLSGVVELSKGNLHTCARLADGTARCWGYNGTYTLGDGTTTQRSSPVTVAGLTRVAGIAAGYRHTCAMLTDNTVRCWGTNGSGEIGDETTIDKTTPTATYAFPCGGGGTSNVCNTSCTPTTCIAQGATSGTISDGCGGTLYCGGSERPQAVASRYFSCAIDQSTHNVECWGDNTYGQLGNGSTTNTFYPVRVQGVSNAIALVSGNYYVCALLGDRTVRCWGYNAYGQLGDGTTTNRTTAVAVPGLSNVQSITGGANHVCARLADDTARCWGYNGYGQLGDGTTTQRTVPVAVSGLSSIVSIGAGTNHSCAVLSNGLVRCWGLNSSGQLGNGTVQSVTPVHVPYVTNAVAAAVASTSDYSCVLLSDGTARCWGVNTYGQLGDGTTATRTTPVAVSGLTNAVELTAKDITICAKLADNTARCWGYNGNGQIGDGTTTQRNTPVAVTGLTNVLTIAPGFRHTCAIFTDNTVQCWGTNSSGELGDLTDIARISPAAVYAFPCGGGGTSNVCNTSCTPTTCAAESATGGTISDGCGGTLYCGNNGAQSASAGYYFSCAITPSATVECWGYNNYGMLGNGSTATSFQPVQVSGLSNVISISSGDNYTCALLGDRTVRCWGYNAYGQLGDGTTTTRTTPVAVSGLSNVMSLSAGRNHACARRSDGTARCWGLNGNGQLGDGTTTQRSIPVAPSGLGPISTIAAGSTHTCAALTNGLVRCWGANGSGQMGNGTTAQYLPTAVPNVDNVVQVEAAGDATWALRSDGTVRSWGVNTYGQLGDGTTATRTLVTTVAGLSNVVELTANEIHVCAKLSDDTARCWGYNGNGQLGDGSTTQRNTPTAVVGVANIVTMAPGYRHTCARLADDTVKCWGTNSNGELGDQTDIARITPATVYAFPCGGGGTSNVCNASCTPTSCAAEGATSGTIADGCGGTLFCGRDTTQLVTGGIYFSCAITPSGTVECWGYNTYGALGNGSSASMSFEPVQVPGISSAISLVSGDNYVCALLADRTVRCWGYNAYGQLGDGTTTQRGTPVTVSGLTNVRTLSAGRNHACARLADGTARCWGYNANGQLGDGTTTSRSIPVQVSGLAGVASIAAGSTHSCAVLTNGLVRCWGSNGSGQLGNGTTAQLTPVAVPSVTNAVAVEAAGDATWVTLSNGTVQAWGVNTYGQLGDGTTATRTLAVSVPGLSNVVDLTANEIHTCARLSDGTAVCWGYNGNGQLGDGTTTQRNTPTAVVGLTNLATIAPAYRHTCAERTDGTVYCWGTNSYGELGDQTNIARINPAAVYAFPCGGGGTSNVCNAACTPTTCVAQGVTAGTISDGCGGTLFCGASSGTEIGAGSNFACGLRSDGTVRCWGYNAYGQLGDGTTTQRTAPVTVSGISSATSIAVGEDHACALLADATVRCWGYNAYGQLGDGSTTQRTSPVAVLGLSNVLSITAGRLHTCARLADGTASCWGYNASYQLGDGTTTQRNVPVTVPGLSDVVAVSGGYNHSCALTSNGLVSCWGANAAGQLGNGTTTWTTPAHVAGLSGAVSIAAAAIGDQTCAALSDGTARCWGSNGYGQLGDGTTATRTTPVAVSGLTNVGGLSSADIHTCARLTNGSVSCWGYNGNGELGDGTTTQRNSPTAVPGLTSVLSVASGYRATCAKTASGAVYCWGVNSYGQLGDGTTTQRNTPTQVTSF